MKQYTSIKISVFGDSGNGKTSLINRFVNNKFDIDCDSTIGIDFKVKIIDLENKEKIKVCIWDTAGQEKFASIVKVCYRDVDGIIITYDTTNYTSFLNLNKWISDVENIINLSKTNVIIIGTKTDLDDQRQVPIDEIIDFIKLHKTRYLETSAKDGTNIDIMFSIFVEMIYNRKLQNNLINENKENIVTIKAEQNEQASWYTCAYPNYWSDALFNNLPSISFGNETVS